MGSQCSFSGDGALCLCTAPCCGLPGPSEFPSLQVQGHLLRIRGTDPMGITARGAGPLPGAPPHQRDFSKTALCGSSASEQCVAAQDRPRDLEQQILSSAGWGSPATFSRDEVDKEHPLWFLTWNPTPPQVPWCWEGLWWHLPYYPGIPSQHLPVQMGGFVKAG